MERIHPVGPVYLRSGRRHPSVPMATTIRPMIALIYVCPTTGRSVQTWVADEPPADGRDSMKCLACRMMHLVDRSTGKVVATTEFRNWGDPSAMPPRFRKS
jgi:hypothetical protein